MSPKPGPGPGLGRQVAAVLRLGTLIAVLAVTVGFGVALVFGSPGPGARPLPELLGGGDADALASAGLLGLTLLPLGVLAVAARSFHFGGERRYLVASMVTLGLLAASLLIAALVAPSS